MKDRIEKILNDKKITQAEFADFIGVNRSSVTHIMTGRNKTSDTVFARTLLAFPDISPQWLSEGFGEMYKSVNEDYTPKLSTYSNSEMQQSAQENLFATPDVYIPENQHQNVEIPYKSPFPEQDIRPAAEIIPPQQEEKKDAPPLVEKQIRKIVFFYADKTFEEYYPG